MNVFETVSVEMELSIRMEPMTLWEQTMMKPVTMECTVKIFRAVLRTVSVHESVMSYVVHVMGHDVMSCVKLRMFHDDDEHQITVQTESEMSD